MVNKVILVGNVGQEPDVKMLPSGGKVANLSLATTDSWRDKDGVRQTKTEWHRITVYNENLIKIVEQYVHKGNQIYVEGSIRTKKYVDNTGIEKKSTEIVIQGYNDTIRMLGSKGSEGGSSSSDSYGDDDSSSTKASSSAEPSGDMDDEIPF